MSPKRRIISSDTSDEEDSFKHRRTSLRVNLSYANLTDSGNGSLWKTENENEEASHRLQASEELSRSKSKSINENRSHSESYKGDNCVASEHATNDKDSAKEGVRLKDLRIYLEDINSKERALETKCRRLKDAILSKTKEAFDEEHELSIKITKVLRNEGANDIRANAENESVFVLNKTSDHFSSIFETPSNHHHITMRKRRNSVDKSKLSQRQLFDKEDKQGERETKCRVIENVVLKNLPINILRQSEQSSSPILSSSNKRLSLLRKRSKDRSGKLNNTYSTIHSVHSVDIEAPIICSTFIEDDATSDDEEMHQNVTDRANVDMSPKHTINTVISMEMTKTHGNNRASERSSQNRNPSTNEYIEEEMEEVKGNSSKRNKSASTRRPKDVSRSKSIVRSNTESSDSHCTDEDEDEASVYVDSTVVPQLYGRKSVEEVVKKARETRKFGDKTNTESEKQRTLSLSKSNETIRSSLNVNTSLDAPDESTSKVKNVEKSRKKSLVLDDQRESTSTVRTSLRVNTSTDSVRRRPIRGSNDESSLLQDRYDPEEVDDSNTDNQCSKAAEENTEANNVDYLENISLFERLRNVSERKQLSCENPTVSGKQVSAKEEAKKDEAKNAGSGKSQNNMRASGDSCVEATPYPVSRSFLFKTLLKHKAQNAENSTSLCSNGTNPIENEKESDVMKSSAS